MSTNARIGALAIGAPFVAALALLSGCPVPDAKVQNTTGAGGGASSSAGIGGGGGDAVASSGMGGASASSVGSGGSSAGGAGPGGAGGGPAPECKAPQDCPDTGNECVARTCLGGQCGTDNVDQGTATPTQKNGDCKLFVCDGMGGTTTKEKADDPFDDGNECTDDGCSAGIPTNIATPMGSVCNQGGGKKCDGKGSCVECLAGADCANGVCNIQHQCVAAGCADLVKNGNETDTDCGGACGATCQTGKACLTAGDCISAVCVGNVCKAPDCNDQAKNGTESDVDCGGSCSPCADNLLCGANVDCASGVCTGGVCQVPACNDGVKNGSETDVDCGGLACPLCPTVLLVAGGSSGGILGEFHPGASWSITSTNEKMSYSPGLDITTVGKGLVTLAYSNNPTMVGGPIRFSLWSAGTGFGAFADVGPGVTARGTSLVGSLLTAHNVFYGDDSKHYYSAYKPGGWSPAAEPVGTGPSQSFGPSLAAVTTLGNDVFIAFAGNDGELYDQRRTSGAWEQPTVHSVKASMNNENLVGTPAITAPTSGPELMIVFTQPSSGQLYWIARSAGVWSQPAAIASALSKDPVAILSAQAGNVLIAYRGTDQKPYSSRYVNGSWGAPLPIASPNPKILSRPSLAKGVGTSSAEVAFIDMAGIAYHSRAINLSWTSPVAVGGQNLTFVTIAGGP